MDTSHFDVLAGDHHGLLTRDSAKRAGMSRTSWYRAIERGQLIGMFPRVARVCGAPETRSQGIASAVMAAQPGSMASHRSAAYLWGVPRPDDDPIDVMLTARTRGLGLDGVILHRPRDRRDLSPVLRSNIRTSNVLRFLCDLGAVDESGVAVAVGYVITNRIASPTALLAAVKVHTRRGRHGVPALRRVLEDWIVDGKPADSVLESEMRRLAERFDLPPMEFHARVAGFEVDFLVTGTSVVVECDGWKYHGKTARQFERDTARDAALLAARYVPVHFTYWQIHRQPQVVAERIRSAVRLWGSGAG